jgi:hypothetical protein
VRALGCPERAMIYLVGCNESCGRVGRQADMNDICDALGGGKCAFILSI